MALDPGINSVFEENSVTRGLFIFDFQDIEFEDAFRKVDNTHSMFITHDEIRILLSHVFGDNPPEDDVKSFMQLMTQQRKVRVNFKEFMEMLTVVKHQRRSQLSSAPARFKSHADFMEHRRRHKRAPYGPRDEFRDPLLTSMQYGWLEPTPSELVEKKPKVYCAETKFAEIMLKTGVETIF